MKVTYRWLQEMVNLEVGPEELAERLTMAGAEVEAVVKVDAKMPGVVVGKVTDLWKDEKRSSVHWCRVAVGGSELTIACGAPNVSVGIKSPVALPGAVLPGGRKIEPRSLGNLVSEGMLCSEWELGLGEDTAGIMILPASSRVGEPVSQALELDDCVIEINVTPNRPDLLSVRGVAREIAALTGAAFRSPSWEMPSEGAPIGEFVSVRVKDYALCPNYTARLIRGIKVVSSPFHLRRRLFVCGFRSVNNVVDATNYVMLESGQPLHAFDFRLLEGGGIIVRPAREGETIVTIDGVERGLSSRVLVIADSAKPVAVAGVMGGMNSEVSAATVEVLLESAFFNPVTVRRSARELGLSTEASRRFERTVDRAVVPEALHCSSALIVASAGGSVAGGWIDKKRKQFRTPVVRLNCSRVSRFLGVELDPAVCVRILSALGLEHLGGKSSTLRFKVPSWRPDLTREADLAEEIARLYGYEKIPTTAPRGEIAPLPPPGEYRLAVRIREILCASGLDEVITYSFMNQLDLEGLELDENDPWRRMVQIANPLSKEEGWLRTTLLPGLLRVVKHNLNRNVDQVEAFEVGRVFLSCGGSSPPAEEGRLALVLCPGREQNGLFERPRPNFFSLKGILEELLLCLGLNGIAFSPETHPFFQPGRSTRVRAGGDWLGWAGEATESVRESFDVARPVFLAEIALDRFPVPGEVPVRFRPLPLYPAVGRDVAIIVDETVAYDDITRAMEELRPPLLEDWRLFDIYRGHPLARGEKSLAFKLIYRSASGTLLDKKVSEVHQAFKEALARRLSCRFRE